MVVSELELLLDREARALCSMQYFQYHGHFSRNHSWLPSLSLKFLSSFVMYKMYVFSKATISSVQQSTPSSFLLPCIPSHLPLLLDISPAPWLALTSLTVWLNEQIRSDAAVFLSAHSITQHHPYRSVSALHHQKTSAERWCDLVWALLWMRMIPNEIKWGWWCTEWGKMGVSITVA